MKTTSSPKNTQVSPIHFFILALVYFSAGIYNRAKILTQHMLIFLDTS